MTPSPDHPEQDRPDAARPVSAGRFAGAGALLRLPARLVGLWQGPGRGEALSPVLPARSIAGRALVLVIVIMTFLAGVTAGAVHLIADASRGWSADLAREMTIQIRPLPGRNIEADLREASELARRTRGIEAVRVFSRIEAEKLLEPWLGVGLDLSELPVPRLIVLKLVPGVTPDLAALKASLAERVPNAGLDDHRLWLGRLKLMADSLVVIGLVILALVLVATALAVAFATRGAMAGTAHIIDVLHLVGAEDRYIAREFQRHFLRLGLRGGLAGGVLAVVFYLAISLSSGRFAHTPGAEQVEALFGRFSLPLGGYVSVLLIGLVVSIVTAVVSRVTVYRTLGGEE
jgi:cell division transport system permease protein